VERDNNEIYDQENVSMEKTRTNIIKVIIFDQSKNGDDPIFIILSLWQESDEVDIFIA
jgi:hypothetical protein